MKLLSRVAGLLVLLVLLILILRGDLFSRSPLVILAQIAALALAAWARRSFQAGQFRVAPAPGAGPLLRAGPYRFVRHPMYAGALLLIWAGVLGHWSLGNAALGLVAVAAVGIRIVDEERGLREHFPDYPEYCRRTKRLVPGVF